MKKQENILVIGGGYVGLAKAAFLASKKITTHLIDNNPKVVKALNRGELLFYEPELKKNLKRALASGYLIITEPDKSLYQTADIIFVVIDSANRTNFKMNLKPFQQIAKWIGETERKRYPIVVLKSTNVLGFADKFDHLLNKTNYGQHVDVLVNPEFLREGFSFQDTIDPWRVIIGAKSQKAATRLKQFYKKLYGKSIPVISDGWKAAELIKLGSNLYLAHRLSFINEIADCCRQENIDIDLVREGLGSDPRIGKNYFKPGLGFGGACLPKDCHFINVGSSSDKFHFQTADSALKVNARIITNLIKRLKNRFHDLSNQRIAILGTAFKPETDDLRDSQAIKLAEKLTKAGAMVVAFDPFINADNVTNQNTIIHVDSISEAVKSSSVIIIGTAHKRFKQLKPTSISKEVKSKLIIDYFGILNRKRWSKAGFEIW